ncbi:endolytic transglycosylase MltG [Streptomyces qinzhouensis]|uniref:Endolytic murein transglycosylase n=1 Tax=Streptomyces qinzhouensis TaxID=2599401 RepID=A0A5B8J3L8_9ACTN|nr:endolytic transglycosylase MltG [Streptomyces qinzhouensis]QDY75867.1 endolytic transglycosylase MltG [Streptomyces qinzhouensis]
MTEYGRGPGSEPWHPDDPFYGDQGQGPQPVSGHDPYGGQQQYQQQPGGPQQAYGAQDPYQQQAQAQDPYQQQYQQHPGGQQYYPGEQQYDGGQQQYDGGQSAYGAGNGAPGGQGQWDGGGYPHQAQDPQQHPAQGGHPQQAQHQGGHPHQTQHQGIDPQQAAHQHAPQQGQPPHPADPGVAYGAAPGDTYAANPADTYSGPVPGYQGQAENDYYATPDAYPPPQPPGRRPAEPEAREGEWDAEAPEEEKHPFFTGDGEDRGDETAADDDPAASRTSRRRGGDGAGDGERRGGRPKKKSRNGCACLVVSAVLLSGLGGVSYFGYQFWQGQFGSAPDYSGAGSGSVIVEIPPGAGLAEIGRILKQQGVVKSSGAFVSAANGNQRAKGIQAGVYTLAKEMSGANAVKAMLDPRSSSNMIIPEGKRNAEIYALIDKRLQLKAGTTAKTAKEHSAKLGLPAWAKGGPDVQDPLEGFLFPAAYPAAKGMKPEAVLKKMVARANEEHTKAGLADKAAALGLKNALEVLTVASLVQAEGKYKEDFDKVARVVYNRLKPDNTETNGLLDFDSTVNYARGESKLAIGSVNKVRKFKHPYNTYSIEGLPPGPIGNPGMAAINSTLNPAEGGWYYFVSVTEDETVFSVNHEDHERARQRYLEELKKNQE